MRRALLVPLLVSLCLLSATARADAEAIAKAKQRFTAAAQAYRDAHYKDAIDLFLEANRLDPHADLTYNVGQAYEKLGDVANALRSYREYLRIAPGATDRGTVETSIRNLETRLQRERGLQQVSVFSTPAGATLVLDGKPVGATPCTFEIAPGGHVAVLRATGYPDMVKEFVLLARREPKSLELAKRKRLSIRHLCGPIGSTTNTQLARVQGSPVLSVASSVTACATRWRPFSTAATRRAGALGCKRSASPSRSAHSGWIVSALRISHPITFSSHW
jgi:hypothetical protein